MYHQRSHRSEENHTHPIRQLLGGAQTPAQRSSETHLNRAYIHLPALCPILYTPDFLADSRLAVGRDPKRGMKAPFLTVVIRRDVSTNAPRELLLALEVWGRKAIDKGKKAPKSHGCTWNPPMALRRSGARHPNPTPSCFRLGWKSCLGLCTTSKSDSRTLDIIKVPLVATQVPRLPSFLSRFLNAD